MLTNAVPFGIIILPSQSLYVSWAEHTEEQGLGLCSIGPRLNRKAGSLSHCAKCFLSFQMIRLVWTSSAGVTWSLSTESATTNFMESSVADHAQGKADLGVSSPSLGQDLTRPSLGLVIKTTTPRGNPHRV